LKHLATQLDDDDISPLLNERLIFLETTIEDGIAKSMITQLLYLQSEHAAGDIHLSLNSPGGNVYAGLAIYDMMQLVRPDITTHCTSQAGGCAALLLAAGAKGKRSATANSTIQLVPLLGAENSAAIEITAREILRLRRLLAELFALHTGQSQTTLLQDMDRGRSLTAREALAYGLIDQIIDAP